MAVKILKQRCPQSHRCPSVHVCPVKALKQDGNAAPSVIDEKCRDCNICVDYCPMGAIVSGTN